MDRFVVSISRRFNGPPNSANGGYVCGLMTRLLGAPAQVTLHRPPGLERPMRVVERGSALQLEDGDAVVAEAIPASFDPEPPPPVAFDLAARASRAYPGFEAHVFPTCFVCGPQRRPGDGLRVFAWRVPGRRGIVAAPWVPSSRVAESGDAVSHEIVFAALDCPGIWALMAEDPEPAVVLLGRMECLPLAEVSVGRRCVIVARARGRDGRKLFSESFLFEASGALLAAARHTWIRLRTAGA